MNSLQMGRDDVAVTPANGSVNRSPRDVQHGRVRILRPGRLVASATGRAVGVSREPHRVLRMLIRAALPTRVGEPAVGRQVVGAPVVGRRAPAPPGAGTPVATAGNQFLQVYSEEKVLT